MLLIHWYYRFGSLLEGVEAFDVPVQLTCRLEVRHSCETVIIGVGIMNSLNPFDQPVDRKILLCGAVFLRAY